MNIKSMALLGGFLLLAGCPGEEPTNTDTDPTGETGDTDPTDTNDTDPPPAFEWNIELMDADNAPDNGFDADTIAVSTVNSVANYADVTSWEFGFAETANNDGWTGEDCDGVVTQGSDFCHTMAPDTTLTMTRVETIGELETNGVFNNDKTLTRVDFPISGTPGKTWVLFGYNSAGTIAECFVTGHSIAYYASANCDTYTPAM